MKTFTRGLFAALVTLTMIGMTGCADNEGEATKLSKGIGDPGPVNPKAIPTETQPAPQTQADFKKQADEAQSKLYQKGSGYPGTKK